MSSACLSQQITFALNQCRTQIASLFEIEKKKKKKHVEQQFHACKINLPDEECQACIQQGFCYFSSGNLHDPLSSIAGNSVCVGT